MTVRVLGASARRARSERGWNIAVEYIVEGQSGTEMAWLDDFLDEHAVGVEVGE